MYKNLVALIVVALPVMGFASESVIPYALSCSGPYNLTTGTNGNIDIVVLAAKNGKTIRSYLSGAQVDPSFKTFKVKEVKTTATGFEAKGSSTEISLKGTEAFSLNFNSATGILKYTESLDGFNESKNEVTQETRTYRLLCDKTQLDGIEEEVTEVGYYPYAQSACNIAPGGCGGSTPASCSVACYFGQSANCYCSGYTPQCYCK